MFNMDKRIIDICRKTYDIIIKGNSKITDLEKDYMKDLHKFISPESEKSIEGVIEDITKVATTKTIIKRR